MEVSIIAATNDPMEVISKAAGTCYGKHDVSAKRVESCFKAGHMSVFEHVSATFRVEGISRACSHQLVRHRLASYSQRSQRYCKVAVGSGDWYVVPPCFQETKFMRDYFEQDMEGAARDYLGALDLGVKPEDARYMLPEATKTEIVVTMNCRELFHFLDVRQDKRAQWEIRELACEMERALRIEPDWQALMELRDGDAE